MKRVPNLPPLEVQMRVLRDLHNSEGVEKDSFDLLYAGRWQREKAFLYDRKINLEIAPYPTLIQLSRC